MGKSYWMRTLMHIYFSGLHRENPWDCVWSYERLLAIANSDASTSVARHFIERMYIRKILEHGYTVHFSSLLFTNRLISCVHLAETHELIIFIFDVPRETRYMRVTIVTESIQSKALKDCEVLCLNNVGSFRFYIEKLVWSCICFCVVYVVLLFASLSHFEIYLSD